MLRIAWSPECLLHHMGKLFQVNGATTVNIVFLEQNEVLILCQTQAEDVHGPFKLVLLQQARTVLIKLLEGLEMDAHREASRHMERRQGKASSAKITPSRTSRMARSSEAPRSPLNQTLIASPHASMTV
jgi:hypothetical protein